MTDEDIRLVALQVQVDTLRAEVAALRESKNEARKHFRQMVIVMHECCPLAHTPGIDAIIRKWDKEADG